MTDAPRVPEGEEERLMREKPNLTDETLASMVSVTIGEYLERHPELWDRDAAARGEVKAIYRAGFQAGFHMAWAHCWGLAQIERAETVTVEELRARIQQEESRP